MSPVAIKFCGLTRVADVELACDLAVDYLGLVLAADSPRRLTLDQARTLAGAARARSRPPAIVALLRNPGPGQVAAAIAGLQPDLLQFHGDEQEAFCAGFGRPYWKAFGLAGVEDMEALAGQHPLAAALLLDGHRPGAAGGSGQALAWSRWPHWPRPLVLAGGLDPDNVGAAIRATRPFAVDVSSGIESAPGVKDPVRMRRFVVAARMPAQPAVSRPP